jgi:excisionase family DNA binding protein
MGEEGIQDGDRSAGRQRLTVDQAADQLGLSVDAVRARIKRKTIPHVRGGGRVYILLDDNQGATRHDQDSAQHTDRARHEPDHRDELVEELRDRVRYLEEESRRKDHLLAAALERMPAIEAPTEARESPVTSQEEPVNTPTPETPFTEEDPYITHAPPTPDYPVERPESEEGTLYGTSRQEAEQSLQRRSERSWWRRFFGLE